MSEEKPKKKRRVLKIVILLVVVLGVIGLFMDTDERAPRSTGSTTAAVSALEQANEAYDNDEYERATELYSEVIDRNTRDGIVWYRYAYAKQQAHNEADLDAYLRAWQLLRSQDPDHAYFARAKQRVMDNIRSYRVEVRQDVIVRLESIQFTDRLGGGFMNLQADPGTTYVLYIVSMENNSGNVIGLMTAPVPQLHDFDGNQQREDFEARVYAAATLEGIATGALNPGVRSRFFKIYKVSQDRLAQGGWYLRFADGTELPIN